MGDCRVGARCPGLGLAKGTAMAYAPDPNEVLPPEPPRQPPTVTDPVALPPAEDDGPPSLGAVYPGGGSYPGGSGA